MKRSEICISYDVDQQALTFYNIETKTRMRYTVQNCYNLANLATHIKELKTRIYYPNRPHLLQMFLGRLVYINETGLRSDTRTQMIKDAWDNLWKRLTAR